MTQRQLAPIVLFCYNRLENTRAVVEALQKNHLASASELFIFADGPRDELAVPQVQAVRNYLKTISGFKNITIIEREENYYIERNIIEGVTEIVNMYGKIIVLEDDGVTSPYFLNYMNDALDFYEDKKRVWHISAFTFIEMPEGYDKTFLSRYIENTGGWATWKDRWDHFVWFNNEVEGLALLNDEQKKALTLDGTVNFLGSLKNDPINWDICWYIMIAHHDGLTVHAPRPLMKNNGLYNGSHFSVINKLAGKHPFEVELAAEYDFSMEPVIEESPLAWTLLKDFYKRLNHYNTKPSQKLMQAVLWLPVKLRLTKAIKKIFAMMRYIPYRMKNLTRTMPKSTKQKLRRFFKPAWLHFLFVGKGKPLSDYYGLDRGTPVDRYYIENFLEKHAASIRGDVLELLNNNYTKRFGGDAVSKSEVLDIDGANSNATIVDDLRTLQSVEDASFDCIILTQVLQFIDDVDAALEQCHRVLKPGGTLLVTVPTLSRIDCVSGEEGDFWRFTPAGTRYMVSKHFDTFEVTGHGNVSVAHYFLAGAVVEEVSKKVLDTTDPNFPVVVTVHAQKSHE